MPRVQVFDVNETLLDLAAMLGWVSSGMLLAYNLFSSLRADAQASPESPLVRVAATQAAPCSG